MRTEIVVEVIAADRTRLRTVVANRNSRQKHVWRAIIVLLTADGCGTAEIMRRTGKAKTHSAIALAYSDRSSGPCTRLVGSAKVVGVGHPAPPCV